MKEAANGVPSVETDVILVHGSQWFGAISCHAADDVNGVTHGRHGKMLPRPLHAAAFRPRIQLRMVAKHERRIQSTTHEEVVAIARDASALTHGRRRRLALLQPLRPGHGGELTQRGRAWMKSPQLGVRAGAVVVIAGGFVFGGVAHKSLVAIVTTGRQEEEDALKARGGARRGAVDGSTRSIAGTQILLGFAQERAAARVGAHDLALIHVVKQEIAADERQTDERHGRVSEGTAVGQIVLQPSHDGVVEMFFGLMVGGEKRVEHVWF